MPANSRTNVWLEQEFAPASKPLWVNVEANADIVVERAQYWGGTMWPAGTCAVATPMPRVYSNQTFFSTLETPNHHETFDQFAPGNHPPSLVLGDLSATLTTAGAARISAPGPFFFTTNFLSTGVADNDNNVVVTFPPGTRAAGMYFVAGAEPEVTVTATDFAGGGVSALVMHGDPFVGFSSSEGIHTIRFSSPVNPLGVPFANVGDIWYTR